MRSLARAGLNVFTEATYTPPDGGSAVADVYVAVEDLESEFDGEVTQNGAILSLLRSQVGTPVQGATVEVDGTTWRIDRRLSTTDPSMVRVEAGK